VRRILLVALLVGKRIIIKEHWKVGNLVTHKIFPSTGITSIKKLKIEDKTALIKIVMLNMSTTKQLI